MKTPNPQYAVAIRSDLINSEETVKEEPPPSAEYQAKRKRELEESIKYAEAEQLTLHLALADLRGRISNMEGDFEERFASLSDLCSELEEKIKQLEDELNEPLPGDFDSEPKPERATADKQTAPKDEPPANREERRKNEKKAKKKTPLDDIKKLFRRIASRCHPDKTTDPDLHALFREARKYYAAKNYNALKDIWDVLRGDASSLLGNLMAQLTTIQNHVARTRASLDALRNGATAELLAAYENPLRRNAAYHAAQSSIQFTIDEAVAKSRKLLEAVYERRALVEEIRRSKEYSDYQDNQKAADVVPEPEQKQTLLASVGSKLRLLLSGD